jgi:poly(A) polymerase
MIKKLFNWLKKDLPSRTVIPRSEHNVSRQAINKNALKVLYRLHNAGFSAYLVGGCIRDLLLGKQPKDFDIATNADPEEVRKLFSNCRIIGRRFRLAHVHFGRDIIEVATFRAQHSASTVQNDDGMILRDNEYGTIAEDVMRRDFTVNALYYNIADFSVEDFVEGMHDLKKKQLRLIGEPELRYREDPVRMLRAIRFAAKLQFSIHPQTAKPIYLLNYLLSNIPAARLFEEFTKLFLLGNAFTTYHLLCEYKLFERLFPLTAKFPTDDSLISNVLKNTDLRYAANKSITPSFILAAFLWQPFLQRTQQFLSDGRPEYLALENAMDAVLSEQQRVMSVPRRFSGMVRDVWELQQRLERRRSARSVTQVFALSKFRAAYDFLLLRAESDDKSVIESANWWRNYVEGDAENRSAIETKLKSGKRKPKRKPKAKIIVDTQETE